MNILRFTSSDKICICLSNIILFYIVAVCGFYLGMSVDYHNYTIPNEHIRASNTLYDRPAWHGRLNEISCWIGSGAAPWIQADIGHQTNISGVVTQGDGGIYNAHWVTKIKVSTFSLSTNDTEVFVEDGNGNVIVSLMYRNEACDFCDIIKMNKRRELIS